MTEGGMTQKGKRGMMVAGFQITVWNDTLSYPLSSRSFVVPITSGLLQDDRSLGGTGQAPLRLLATIHSTGATSITLGTGQYRLYG